jgi:hypothetical protein
MLPQFVALLRRQLVNPPIVVLSALNQPMLLEIGQMLGNVDLPLFQHALKVANAEGCLRQQIENAEACLIAEALIDLNKLHGGIMP